jgi:hypothetical protein
MGGRRRGSLRDLRRARNRYEQEKLLNAFLYQGDVRRKKRSALQWFILRHLVSKRQHERRLSELESRISQSSCVEKRDFSNSFDEYNDAKCIDTFRFNMREINELVRLLGLETHADGKPFEFHTPNRCSYTGKEGLLLLLAHLTQAPTYINLPEKGFTFGSAANGSQLVNEVIRWMYLEWAEPLLRPLELRTL